jgi:hypothetical protein
VFFFYYQIRTWRITTTTNQHKKEDRSYDVLRSAEKY